MTLSTRSPSSLILSSKTLDSAPELLKGLVRLQVCSMSLAMSYEEYSRVQISILRECCVQELHVSFLNFTGCLSSRNQSQVFVNFTGPSFHA